MEGDPDGVVAHDVAPPCVRAGALNGAGDGLAAVSSIHLGLLEGLAAVAHAHAGAHDSAGAGLCLPVAAAVGHVLTQHAGVPATAVQGTFDGAGHWWLQVDQVRVDPTRHQFDGAADLLYPVRDADGYVALARFDAAGWSTAELVRAEARRAFMFPAAADQWVHPLLDELVQVAHACARTLGTPAATRR